MEPILLPATETAEMLNISCAHFYRLHNSGKVPRPVRLGRSARWVVEEIKEWILQGMPNRKRWEAIRGGVI